MAKSPKNELPRGTVKNVKGNAAISGGKGSTKKGK